MNTATKNASILAYSSFLFLAAFTLVILLAQPGGAQYFSSNGETIYYTGYNDQGERIPFEGGPMWFSMRGGGCVRCHGPSGTGGQPLMMTREIPADIRYEALISGKHHPGEMETPYTDELIIRAIREGVDPDGKPLDPGMPRWQMTDKDVRDVINYLKTL
jgi:cytochrome c oxidase subunit 2